MIIQIVIRIILFTVLLIISIPSTVSSPMPLIKRKCVSAASSDYDIMPTLSATPEEVFVEIYLYFDEPLSSHLYIENASFWKTIDRYFGLLNLPKIRIRLIERSELKDLSFLESNSLQSFRAKINADGALRNFSQYMFEKRASHYCHDITLLVTRSRLCFPDNQTCDLPAVTYHRGVCSIDNKAKRSKSIAIVHAGNTYFKQVKNIIFAIGQLLGAEIDNNGMEEYFMSDTHDPFYYQVGWSRRSMEGIGNFLNSKSEEQSTTGPRCLFNKPSDSWMAISDQMNAVLPGKVIPIDDYCSQITNYTYSRACNTDDDSCRSLKCSKDGDKCLKVGPAPEGSWCAKNMRCTYGRCQSWEPSVLG